MRAPIAELTAAPIEFFVPGEVHAQGSMRSLGQGRMTHQDPGLLSYRDRVAWYAREARGADPGSWPSTQERWAAFEIRATFFVPRPTSLPKRVVHPVTAKDLDKLQRAIGDALTGILFRDDKQVTRWTAEKAFGEAGVRLWIALHA